MNIKRIDRPRFVMYWEGACSLCNITLASKKPSINVTRYCIVSSTILIFTTPIRSAPPNCEHYATLSGYYYG